MSIYPDLCFPSTAGSFSCVRSDFILERDLGFYIIQVYVPSVLIVILSWVSFWLDVGAIPARISLGVLTVLTMTTQSSGARASLPRVSYIKAIDVWMATCLFFVFASLLEFAYINVLARRRVPYRLCGSAPADSHMQQGEQPTPLLGSSKNGSFSARYDAERGEKAPPQRSENQMNYYGKKGALYMDNTLWRCFRIKRPKQWDRIARVAFPLAFTLFNIGYWCIYSFIEF
ncbi:glycine receptor subunit alpha-1 [Plakobranchus ocellatus]|uniref:Glycine receptor subunit alpha-1 n=1 Tax=Plakobranchus ocellatus TaxID=259542 RepID=A0AAV3XRF0_9GAST|nr:glycine receptor subunit alpha-1 [Plakobranchus ocellatus]